MWQSSWVATQLAKHGVQSEIHVIKTAGDIKDGPLTQFQGQGAFTKELQEALLDERCDLAVHSLKDLPTQPVNGLKLAAVPTREDFRDCLISRKSSTIKDMPDGARIATGSPRRVAQLLRIRPDLHCVSVRGNLDTRLSKLDANEFDGMVLAVAGLKRLNWMRPHMSPIPTSEMVPAAGQGALGLEIRSDDHELEKHLQSCVQHVPSFIEASAEREVLRQLRAGCHSPVGISATLAVESTPTRTKYRLDVQAIVFQDLEDSDADRRSLRYVEESMIFETTQTSTQYDHELALRISKDAANEMVAKLIARGAPELIKSSSLEP